MENYSTDFLESLSKSVDVSFESIFVFPGQNVEAHVTGFQRNIKIGDGLIQDGEAIRSNTVGTLRYREPVSYWVDTDKKSYSPKTGDQVVGIIEDKGGDSYRVNIFSGASAILNKLSFEGATKRNRPDLHIGDVVYCMVSLAHRHLETELTCCTSSGIKKGWSSGEAIYGDLAGGLTTRITPFQAKMLLKPECSVLNLLGRSIPFEIAIGMNGFLWMKANSEVECIIIRNAILNSLNLDRIQTEAMVEILVNKLKQMNSSKS